MEEVVFARMNEQEMAHRRLTRDMQFLWDPVFAFEDQAGFVKDDAVGGLFTHTLFDHYDPPSFVPEQFYKSGGKIKGVEYTMLYAKSWTDSWDK